MAELVERAAPAGAAAASKESRDLDVLHPDREITVGGKVIIVREYGWLEGLQLLGKAKPVLAALTDYARSGDQLARFAEVEQIFVQHTDLMFELVAKAADVELAFLHSLSDEDGYRLMQAWWLANQGFFVRRVIQALATARAVKRRAGPGSTPPSSVPGSAEAQRTSAG